MNINFTAFKTPVGILKVTADGNEITEVGFAAREGCSADKLPSCLKDAKKQLLEYFDGKRKSFNLPLKFPAGTGAFRLKVWKEMGRVPYGKTVSYGELSAKAGNSKAARAAGGACNKNPFMIILPCHRIVGADGGLTGYAGGLNVKKYLLNMEK
ncbi:MAG: methylated-DNA--[protein]-cysteine S-methyltransferase [Elusimicrobium sp.]|jgi:methylated-DNA-[protein]-cysteine S-methyltransferase|nr:methylated-DNA--[protein]-cysteine S-methyltransferase [Elusimicrobium sp.]